MLVGRVIDVPSLTLLHTVNGLIISYRISEALTQISLTAHVPISELQDAVSLVSMTQKKAVFDLNRGLSEVAVVSMNNDGGDRR